MGRGLRSRLRRSRRPLAVGSSTALASLAAHVAVLPGVAMVTQIYAIAVATAASGSLAWLASSVTNQKLVETKNQKQKTCQKQTKHDVMVGMTGLSACEDGSWGRLRA